VRIPGEEIDPATLLEPDISRQTLDLFNE
jgi:hypothetical protein